MIREETFDSGGMDPTTALFHARRDIEDLMRDRDKWKGEAEETKRRLTQAFRTIQTRTKTWRETHGALSALIAEYETITQTVNTCSLVAGNDSWTLIEKIRAIVESWEEKNRAKMTHEPFWSWFWSWFWNWFHKKLS